jgi:CheY-like chemotaxis protein
MPLYQIAFADASAAERKALTKILRNAGGAALQKGIWQLHVTTSAESIRAALEVIYGIKNVRITKVHSHVPE